jgi:hypothetical protein
MPLDSINIITIFYCDLVPRVNNQCVKVTMHDILESKHADSYPILLYVHVDIAMHANEIDTFQASICLTAIHIIFKCIHNYIKKDALYKST